MLVRTLPGIVVAFTTSVAAAACAPVSPPYTFGGYSQAAYPYAGPTPYTPVSDLSCPSLYPGAPAALRAQLARQCRSAQAQQWQAERQAQIPQAAPSQQRRDNLGNSGAALGFLARLAAQGEDGNPNANPTDNDCGVHRGFLTNNVLADAEVARRQRQGRC